MAVRSPPQTSSDPFQLDRLAEELLHRESAVATRQDADSQIHDLPDFTPLSHDNSFLTNSDFKVEEFLLSRSNTSLPDLRTELREYLAQLKEELVKLINDDYEAFISLSTDLRDEGDRLVRIQYPLGDLKSQVIQSRSELQVIQDAIQEKLEKRAILREENALLHLLLKLSESATRLESLLLISSPDDASGSIEVNSMRIPAHLSSVEEGAEDRSGGRAKHLGRVAAEYMQLLYHAEKARAEKCKFVDEMQWRIDRIQSTISSDLDHVFAATLVALTDSKGEGKASEVEKNILFSDLTECLRTYDILRLWRDAEDVLKNEVVRSFVKKTMYSGALAAPHSPILPHTPLPTAKSSSLSVATLPPRTPYTPFTSYVSTRNTSSYPLGSYSVSPFAHLLEDTDDPLARLYSQTLRFVERDLSRIMDIAEKVSVKSLSHSRSEKGILVSMSAREHPTDGKGFEIMANVIWEELGRAIIDELGGIVFASGRPNDFRKVRRDSGHMGSSGLMSIQHHALTQAFIRSLEYLAPSVHSVEALRAHPVYFAFEQRWQLQVYFQIRWKEIISPLEDSLAVARIDASFEKGAFSNIGTPSQTRSSTPTSAEPSSAESITADEAILRQNVAVIVDIKAMRNNTRTMWREEISMMLPEASDAIEDETDGVKAQEALSNVLSSLSSLVPPMSNEIITILTRRCCDALLPVRSIPSQFRAMSNKRSPTEPSYFVASILHPVKAFFGVGVGDGPGAPLSEDHVKPYATEVFDNVSQRHVHLNINDVKRYLNI
ncbi:hypothetical protein DXG03_003094 [Asterophora parasitica]|uniref:Conserved oligomeric Golgi complex subunit 2 n=1 Tax=Asterophora parasitica TaxID=117018 RepID=A0A9P7GH39_9AGAR|nr:hypothetical protein DXG03_003094 [Asterophora parasitica]